MSGKLREEDKAKLLREFHWPKGTHPIEQASLWSDCVLYPWQKAIIDEVSLAKSRVVASTPNEAGKTSEIIPILGLSIMAAFPGSLVISTAGSETQIKEQLFPYLDAKLARYPDWKVSTSELSVQAPRVDPKLRRSRWIGIVPRDPKTGEGYHDTYQIDSKGNWRFQPVFYIVDEAKSIRPGIIEAIFRIDPFFTLMISTPGEEDGAFYDALDPDTIELQDQFSPENELWTYRVMINWMMCPHLQTPEKRTIREKLIRRYGLNSAFVQSMMFGGFYREGQTHIFDDSRALQSAMSGMARKIKGPRAAGLDLSAGGDEQVLTIREGTKIIHLEAHREHDTFRLAQEFVATLRRFRIQPEAVVIDVGGVGAPIARQMEAMGYTGMDQYISSQDAQDQVQFANRAAEDHFHLRDYVRAGMVQIPFDEILLKQMKARKYELDNKNRIKLESKEKIKVSPDRLDSLTMCFSGVEPIEVICPQQTLTPLQKAIEECLAPQPDESDIWGEKSYFGGMLMEQ